MEAFTSSKTKAELFELAQRRRVLLAPVATVEDVVESEQLAARGYWEDVDGIQYPGGWIEGGVSRLPADASAPEVGEHTEQVLAEVRGPAVEIARSTQNDVLPLAGLKVLDFMWAVAGPAITRQLTDAGATIVRVESSTKLDACRVLFPFLNNEPGIENSGLFNNVNTDKQGITLNLNTEAGLGVARDLCKWADVVCEAYTPRAMKTWGLDYESIKKLNPSVVMLSTCLFGHSGPLADFAGYGNLGGAMAGFYNLTGWPDRPPAGPFGAITDYTSPHPAAATLLAAVDHQRRTGEGQYLDFSQAEASIHLLTPALLDFQHNGRIAGARGNSSDRACPHGIFPTSGDDEWVAVVAQDDAAWVKLAQLVGHPELADWSLADRLERAEALEEFVSDWTRGLTAEEAETRCQASGIAAHRVQNSPELMVDPQLTHRRHWVELEHSLHGSMTAEAARFVMSRTPIGPRRAAPMLGEHLFETLTDHLGYDADQIAELAAAEAFD